MIHRRGLIGGLIGLVAAPAIVRATSIMPVRLWKPRAGKWLFDVTVSGEDIWHEFELTEGPIGKLVYAPPNGFVGWEIGDTIQFAADFKEKKGWWRKSTGTTDPNTRG